jgi:hypothetical protein
MLREAVEKHPQDRGNGELDRPSEIETNREPALWHPRDTRVKSGHDDRPKPPRVSTGGGQVRLSSLAHHPYPHRLGPPWTANLAPWYTPTRPPSLPVLVEPGFVLLGDVSPSAAVETLPVVFVLITGLTFSWVAARVQEGLISWSRRIERTLGSSSLPFVRAVGVCFLSSSTSSPLPWLRSGLIGNFVVVVGAAFAVACVFLLPGSAVFPCLEVSHRILVSPFLHFPAAFSVHVPFDFWFGLLCFV